MMNPRRQPDHLDAAAWRRALRPLLGALSLLLLGGSSAAPARAEGGTISGPRTGPIFVNAGEILNVVDGAQISGGAYAVYVNGGTANISGGSLSGYFAGVTVYGGGTVNISGGSISGINLGIHVVDGTANISGGTITGDFYVVGVNSSGRATVNIRGGSFSPSQYGMAADGGAVSIYGCGLQLSATGQLTGTLQDGTPINIPTLGLGPNNLINACTYAWSGVLPPLNADGSSVFKLGSTVPVKFRLTGASAGITTLRATLSVAKISDSVVGTEAEAVSTGAATSGSYFRYTDDHYQFNWSTRGLTPGTYQLRIDLGDGALYTVIVSLR